MTKTATATGETDLAGLSLADLERKQRELAFDVVANKPGALVEIEQVENAISAVTRRQRIERLAEEERQRRNEEAERERLRQEIVAQQEEFHQLDEANQVTERKVFEAIRALAPDVRAYIAEGRRLHSLGVPLGRHIRHNQSDLVTDFVNRTWGLGHVRTEFRGRLDATERRVFGEELNHKESDSDNQE